MRSPKSRSRNKSNRNNNNRSVGNVTNRVFDSSGPEGKVRGTPQQIIDKYNQLARDAQLSGDRVATENFQQHAEHYLRLLSVAMKEQEARREEQERQNRERQEEQERQNRERQAERDRERAERRERDGNAPSDPSEAPQPDLGAGAPSSDLVETPESKSETPKRPRKPRRKPRPVEPVADSAVPAGDPSSNDQTSGGPVDAGPVDGGPVDGGSADSRSSGGDKSPEAAE